MKKTLTVSMLFCLLALSAPCFAGTHGVDGHVSARSVGASLLSLIIWPGLGQIVNDQHEDKVVTHALLGLTGIFRFWSFYDTIIDRDGGVWHNRI